MSKVDKQKRKEILKALKEKEREEFEKNMPISKSDCKRLFDYLDGALKKGCFHDLKLTETFLVRENLSSEKVIDWLRGNGGFCDCEVLANVEDKVICIFGENYADFPK